jgi:hypothetical protein
MSVLQQNISRLLLVTAAVIQAWKRGPRPSSGVAMHCRSTRSPRMSQYLHFNKTAHCQGRRNSRQPQQIYLAAHRLRALLQHMLG